MTKQEYKQLEILLGKLEVEVGPEKRIAIIPNHINDGVHLAVYGSSGIMLKETQAATIEDAVKNLKTV